MLQLIFGGIELSEFGGAVSFDYQKGAKEVRISNGKASFKVGGFCWENRGLQLQF